MGITQVMKNNLDGLTRLLSKESSLPFEMEYYEVGDIVYRDHKPIKETRFKLVVREGESCTRGIAFASTYEVMERIIESIRSYNKKFLDYYHVDLYREMRKEYFGCDEDS